MKTSPIFCWSHSNNYFEPQYGQLLQSPKCRVGWAGALRKLPKQSC